MEPIQEPVKTINQTKANAMEKAFEDLTKVDLRDVIGAETRMKTIEKVDALSDFCAWLALFLRRSVEELLSL